MTRKITLALCALGFSTLAIVDDAQGDWPHWRGPNHNGSTTDPGPGIDWDANKNIAWEAKLHGGGSTPIVHGEHIFLTAQDGSRGATYAIALDRKTGKERWKHKVGKGFSNKFGNTAASPSPVTDGKHVYFMFGSGELIACDYDGTIIWQRDLQKDHGKFEILWNDASSPTLIDGTLIVQVLQGNHRDKSPGKGYLLGIKADDGKDKWKVDRPSKAVFEGKQAYSTPIPFEVDGKPAFLIVGGDHLTAHDVATGKELWRSDNYNESQYRFARVVTSPVVANGHALICGPRSKPMYAVALTKSGKLESKSFAWTQKRGSPDVCTPAVHNDHFYVLDGDSKKLARIDPKTGKPTWSESIGGRTKFQASPTIAGGYIYCIDMKGLVVIAKTGEEFEQVKQIDLKGSDVRSSIVIDGKQALIRVDDRLICIGKE